MSTEFGESQPQNPLPFHQLPEHGTPEHVEYVSGRAQSIIDDPVAMQKIEELLIEANRIRAKRQSSGDSIVEDRSWRPSMSFEPPYTYEGEPLTPDELRLITPGLLPEGIDPEDKEARYEHIEKASFFVVTRGLGFEDTGPFGSEDSRRKVAGEKLGRPTIAEFLKSEWARIAREQNADGNHLMQDVSLDTPKGDE